MIPFTESSVEGVFDSYPDYIRSRTLALRDLIFTTAQRLRIEKNLVETLKWGEPSYVCPGGATLRLHWKEDAPDHYRMFFPLPDKAHFNIPRLVSQ